MQPRNKPTGTADLADYSSDDREMLEGRLPETGEQSYDSTRTTSKDAFDRPETEQTGARRNAADAFETDRERLTSRESSGAATTADRDRTSRTGEDRTGGPHTSSNSFETTHEETRRRAASSTGSVVGAPSQDGPAQLRSDGSPLLSEGDSSALRSRWEECQRSFVDEPRASVKGADELVAEVMQKLARQFADTRRNLESQWDRGDEASTEDLRLALQRYRDFFNRLLAV
jgi:hypothetical protein